VIYDLAHVQDLVTGWEYIFRDSGKYDSYYLVGISFNRLCLIVCPRIV
jgi:hypothetical protein